MEAIRHDAARDDAASPGTTRSGAPDAGAPTDTSVSNDSHVPMDFPAELKITDPDVISMLSNPTRLLVLEELYDRQEPRTATQLSQLAGVSPSSMSYHLRLLGKAGLIRRADDDGVRRREMPWRAAAKSFSFAVSAQPDPMVRMRLMDGILRALRMRINAVMDASAAVPIEERRERYPYTPLSTGNLILDRDELLQVQREIWAVWERYEKLSEKRNAADHDYRIAYTWSCLPLDPDAKTRVSDGADDAGPDGSSRG